MPDAKLPNGDILNFNNGNVIIEQRAWLEGLGLEEVEELQYRHKETGLLVRLVIGSDYCGGNISFEGEGLVAFYAESRIACHETWDRDNMTNADARRFAAALVLAADIAEKWNTAHEEGK